MRSNGTPNFVPEVPAAQLTLDQTRKHLRKLRWIGNELEAPKILQALDDARLRPSLPGDRRKRNPCDCTAFQETSPVCAD
jgi:hypothetical protein